MGITRRHFVRNSISAVVTGVALPGFLSTFARAQGRSVRNLVVLNLTGGHDGLSMLVPYTDPFYYSRRPTIGIPAGTLLQVGTDSSGKPLGIHPKLTSLLDIFNQGRLALIQRAGYANSSRSHFQGTDIWSTANPANSQGPGWLGQYLATLPAPLDPLTAWNTGTEPPHTLLSPLVSVASIPSAAGYAFNSPNTGTEAARDRTAAQNIASYLPNNQPSVAFVANAAQAAISTLDRVATVGLYKPSVTYPNTGVGLALQTVAGAMVKGIGTKVFFVQTGGFDTHASQDPIAAGGTYTKLMVSLNDSLNAFYNDLKNVGLIGDTLVLTFSEFGRRITENGSRGTDHGAASVMLAMGGNVRGGLYGTAASLNPDPQNPTLENSGGDIHYETDFRSVYARVIDNWLGGDSTAILGGDFRVGTLNFV
jgi:uncharacterized protein (DUF1501 family)